MDDIDYILQVLAEFKEKYNKAKLKGIPYKIIFRGIWGQPPFFYIFPCHRQSM